MVQMGMPTLIELPEPEACTALCAQLGLQFVELNMNLPQYQPDQIDEAEIMRLSGQYGIFYTIHLDENLNVSDFNPLVAQAYSRTVEATIEAAKRLRIPVLNMHLSPGVYFTLPDRRVYLFDEYREKYLQSIRRFREECEKSIGGSGIKVCVENCGKYTDFQVQALDLLLESPVFGLTFDIGHDHCIGGANEPFLLDRQEKLCHFHFHDALGKKNHLPLGAGEIDLKKYWRLAREREARIVLETKTVEGLKQSVRRIREVAEQ